MMMKGEQMQGARVQDVAMTMTISLASLLSHVTFDAAQMLHFVTEKLQQPSSSGAEYLRDGWGKMAWHRVQHTGTSVLQVLMPAAGCGPTGVTPVRDDVTMVDVDQGGRRLERRCSNCSSSTLWRLERRRQFISRIISCAADAHCAALECVV